MKKIFLALLFAAFGAFALQAQPKIEIVGGDIVDWNDITPKDNPLHSDVKIKNIGNETLKIADVKPTCGCTTAPLGKYELAPGEETTMKVTLNVGSASGKVHKTIRIASNDPSAEMKVVSLRANVIRPIEIKPTSYFTFNKMTVGTESSAKVFLKNNTSKPLTLSSFQVEPSFMKLNISGKKTLKPGEEIELIATLKPQKTGYLNSFVKFKTDNQDLPEIDIRGYGNVEESPLFTPQN